jgi:Zn-finger nucleic acid-binding protein
MRLPDGRQSLTCDYCGAVALPEAYEDGIRVLGEASETKCPVCKIPLAPAALLEHRFLYCTRCRGSLIPMPVFVSLVQNLRARGGNAGEAPNPPNPPDPRDLQRALRCPQCGGAMDTHYYLGGGHVVIDDCSRCELNWLDAGELQTIARTPDHSLDESPPAGSDW